LKSLKEKINNDDEISSPSSAKSNKLGSKKRSQTVYQKKENKKGSKRKLNPQDKKDSNGDLILEEKVAFYHPV
jgi:hypothetical protein